MPKPVRDVHLPVIRVRRSPGRKRTSPSRTTRQLVTGPKGPVIRAPGGHVIYGPAVVSRCSVHSLCAYTGTEKDRCPECHSTLEVGCEHQKYGGMPRGSRPSLCRECGEIFSSNSAFDDHARLGRECRDPEDVGLVLIERGGYMIWALPGVRPER
jgi:hypothetical protein